MKIRPLLDAPPTSPGDARLPWGEPDFSRRMLAEHLDDRHDMASRHASTIDAHVTWLSTLRSGAKLSVLDLGCGPGLYCERLAAAGWATLGVDISPAAIDFAHKRARTGRSSCEYVHGDLATMDLEGRFDLVLCLFGEISTFGIADVRRLLDQMSGVLADGARVVIERSTLAGVRSMGERSDSWYRSDHGLFGDEPHVVLHESRWFDRETAAVDRWWVLGADDDVKKYETTTWWHGTAFDEALAAAGLVVEGEFADLTGAPHDAEADLDVLVLGAA